MGNSFSTDTKQNRWKSILLAVLSVVMSFMWFILLNFYLLGRRSPFYLRETVSLTGTGFLFSLPFAVASIFAFGWLIRKARWQIYNRVTIAVLSIFPITLLFATGFTFGASWKPIGCTWWDCAPNRSFDILDLALPSNLFPTGTNDAPMRLQDEENLQTYRTSVQTFSWDYGHCIDCGASYDVSRYPSSKISVQGFPKIKDYFFSWRWDGTGLSRPKELTYMSQFADEFFVACGERNDVFGYQCGLIARYQEYVVFFNATLTHGMTYQRFENIVVYIDKQMSGRLY